MFQDLVFSLFILGALETVILQPRFFIWLILPLLLFGFLRSKDILAAMIILLAFVYLALVDSILGLHLVAVAASLAYFLMSRRYFEYSLWVYLAAFFWFFQIYSFYMSLYLPLWLMVCEIVAVSMVLYFSLLSKLFKQDKFKDMLKDKGALMVMVGFIIGETVWVLSFLPFNPLTISALLLIVFYVLGDFIEKHLLSKLTRKIIVSRVALGLTYCFLVLLSTQWLPN